MKAASLLLLSAVCVGLVAPITRADLDVQILSQHYRAGITVGSSSADPKPNVNCWADSSGPPPFSVQSGTERNWVSASGTPFVTELAYHIEDPFGYMSVRSHIETTFSPLHAMPVEIAAYNQGGWDWCEVCLRDTTTGSLIAGAWDDRPGSWIGQTSVVLEPDHVYYIYVEIVGVCQILPDMIYPQPSWPDVTCIKSGFEICEVPAPAAPVLVLSGLLSCNGLRRHIRRGGIGGVTSDR
jgi:hypothetical protein